MIKKHERKWSGTLYDKDGKEIENYEAVEFKQLVTGLVVLARRNDLLDET